MHSAKLCVPFCCLQQALRVRFLLQVRLYSLAGQLHSLDGPFCDQPIFVQRLPSKLSSLAWDHNQHVSRNSAFAIQVHSCLAHCSQFIIVKRTQLPSKLSSFAWDRNQHARFQFYCGHLLFHTWCFIPVGATGALFMCCTVFNKLDQRTIAAMHPSLLHYFVDAASQSAP